MPRTDAPPAAPCDACEGTGTDFCLGGPFECGACEGTGESPRSITIELEGDGR
jgi:DnaJ-class molecular chaperone